MSITIAIPTFGRERVLVDTINALLTLDDSGDEIIIVDQTPEHEELTTRQLEFWQNKGMIRWIRLQYPSITRAMNIGLRKAKGNRVLFLDDDIVPGLELVKTHREAGEESRNSIIAGRVLQPWHKGEADIDEKKFYFNSLKAREVKDFMGGNVSIPKDLGIRIGGFDTNFVRVAYHFEAEFAYRWRTNGGRIYYEPKALIHHLKTERGGTRSYGNHLKTIRPDHAVGRYYYYLCTNTKKHAIRISLIEMIKCVATKHHLRNPIWIPITFVAEIKGFIWSLVLYTTGRGLIEDKVRLLIMASHPGQYSSTIYEGLALRSRFKSETLYLTIPDKKFQSQGDPEFEWDIPLLKRYDSRVSSNNNGKDLRSGFFGVQSVRTLRKIKQCRKYGKPDIVLITGLDFYGMLGVILVCIASGVPILLRMESNTLKFRNKLTCFLYRKCLSFVDIGLAITEENRDFLVSLGMKENRLIRSPQVVDNRFFAENASALRKVRSTHRSRLNIPVEAFCYVFVGKLQSQKRPIDLLQAFEKAYAVLGNKVFLLVVGTGVLGLICRRFVEERSLPVVFTGFVNQSDIPIAYAVSDCIVLPSDTNENWGLVINEAMACGLPAIVSDQVGCAKDLVQEGVTGYRYVCGDITRLSELMIEMARNPKDTEAMGECAKKLVSSKYSFESVIDGIDEAVSRIIG